MAAIRRVSFPWTTAYSNSSSVDGVFIVLTGWMSAPDVAKVRATWEATMETSANLVTRPGFQTANVENSPDNPQTLGSDSLTSVGVKFGTALTDITSSTQAKALVRFGIWVKLASGGSLACVQLAGSFDIQSP